MNCIDGKIEWKICDGESVENRRVGGCQYQCCLSAYRVIKMKYVGIKGDDEMRLTPTFWAAFYAGLASPVSLYSAPAPYMAYIRNYTVPQAFGLVGMYLNQAVACEVDVRPPNAGQA